MQGIEEHHNHTNLKGYIFHPNFKIIIIITTIIIIIRNFSSYFYFHQTFKMCSWLFAMLLERS